MVFEFFLTTAEYTEEIPFAQSGDDDWTKTYGSNLRNVFVCRRFPANKNLILCALCASAVIIFAGLAQPKADPSQPKADPSSGGLWQSLGAKIFILNGGPLLVMLGVLLVGVGGLDNRRFIKGLSH